MIDEKDIVAAFPITYLTAYHLLHTMGHITAGQTVTIYNVFDNHELFRNSMKTLVQYLVDGKIKPQIHEKFNLSEASP